MSIAFRSVSATSVGATLSSHDATFGYYVSLALPSGLTVGDLLVMVAATNAPDNQMSPQPAVGNTSFWHLAAVGGFGAGPGGYTVFYKVADAADVAAGSLRIGYTASSGKKVSAAFLAWSGDPQTVTVAVSTALVGSGSLVAPSETARVAGVATRVYVGTSGSSTSQGLSNSPPAGTTLRSDLTTTAASTPEALVVGETIASPGAVVSRAATANGGHHIAVSLMIEGPHPPDQPSITAPGSGAVLDAAGSNEFDWSFSDVDPGDSQSGFDFRYSSNGGSSWTTVSATTATRSVTITGGTFAAGSYQAQIRVYDQASQVSPWSASEFFTVAGKPATPSITSPAFDGDAADFMQTVAWSAADQDAYEIRRVADNAGSPDTGTVYSDTFVNSTVDRAAAVTFDVNGRTEHLQVRVKHAGLFSDWADRRVDVDWVPPGTPDLTITTSDSSAAIQVDIATTDADHVDLYVSDDDGATSWRYAANIDPDSTVIYWQPAAGRDYTFQAIAYATDGAIAASGWTGSASGTPSDLRTTIIDGGGP